MHFWQMKTLALNFPNEQTLFVTLCKLADGLLEQPDYSVLSSLLNELPIISPTHYKALSWSLELDNALEVRRE